MKQFFTLLFILLCSKVCYSQAGSVSLVPFSSGYTSPLGIENCGDSRLFIVQQGGQIIVSDSLGNKQATPFLDISDRILASGEQGLLGLAFDPNYTNNGFFYVNYINTSGNTQISRFKVNGNNPNKAIKGSEKFILQIQQPYSNHNGGCLRFGRDGFLYIGMGDGGSGGDPQNNAQNPASLLGKILRINIHSGSDPYRVPASNPFVDSASYRKEIWALGMRNPWRFSFDALNGALLIADVGQGDWEEIDMQLAKSKGGENYGWRCYEGNHTYNTGGCLPQSNYVSPVYEYQHAGVTGDCSVTGGFVYRGKKYKSLSGNYFFTDYCSGIIRTLTHSNGVYTKTDVFTGDKYAYTSFGEDYNHELFITNVTNGSIYRIVPSATLTGSTPVAAVMNVYPNPAYGAFAIKFTTQKSEECSIAVYGATGRQVYVTKKTSFSGDNVWNITLPAYAKGSCYVAISTASGSLIRQNILVR